MGNGVGARPGKQEKEREKELGLECKINNCLKNELIMECPSEFKKKLTIGIIMLQEYCVIFFFALLKNPVPQLFIISWCSLIIFLHSS